MNTRSITEIVGKTPSRITVIDERLGFDAIVFDFTDGSSCKFGHEAACCESVTIDDMNGDWDSLIAHPLLVAEERASGEPPEGCTCRVSCTWTFYTFRGIKGSVDVRWFGESNGEYSEKVDITFMPAVV